jgi:hypothetical protein
VEGWAEGMTEGWPVGKGVMAEARESSAKKRYSMMMVVQVKL